MKPVRTIRAGRRYILPDGDESSALWVEDRRAAESGAPVIASTWQPTDEERQAIAMGANVELRVWGIGQPPVHVGVSEVMLGALEVEGKDVRLDLRETEGISSETGARAAGQRFRAETYAAGGNIAGDVTVLYSTLDEGEKVVVVGPTEEER